MSTCTATLVHGFPAAKLWWAHHVNHHDVKPAFEALNQLINESPIPMYVLVDLSQQPDLPVIETIHNALSGPFRNPRLVEWLVVGSSSLAKIIGRSLSTLSFRNNIKWFESEAAALSYLERVNAMRQQQDA